MHQMDVGIFPKMKMSRLLNRSLFVMDLQIHYQQQRWAIDLVRKIWWRMTMEIYKLIKSSNWKGCLLPWKSYLWIIFLNIWDIFQKFWWFSFSPTFCSYDTTIINFCEILSLPQRFTLPTKAKYAVMDW